MRSFGYDGFGNSIEPYNGNTPLADLFYTRKIEDELTQQLEIMEEYDHTYKLYDHTKEKDLFSVMYMHPEEDPVTGSSAVVKVLEILSLRIPELTNESLSDILSYPKWLLDKIIDSARKTRKSEQAYMEGLDKPK